MIYTFAVIGGGLTATSLICQLVDELLRRGEAGRRLGASLAIDLFEKQGEAGPGLPHSADHVLPFHITNMCARDMTVRVSRPDDFQRWVMGNQDWLAKRFESREGDVFSVFSGDARCVHYPREIMGEYLKDQFDDAVARALRLGIRITVQTRTEVTDLRVHGAGFHLIVATDEPDTQEIGPYHGVLLATGHWFESSSTENFFPSPWPARNLLSSIPQGASVAVIGSSLSAIETVLTLTSDGQFRRLHSGRLVFEQPKLPRKLTLFSRQGLVPRVRGRIGNRLNRWFTCARLAELMAGHNGQVTLAEIFNLLDQELVEAYDAPIDWQLVAVPPGEPIEILRQDLDRAIKGDGPNGELVWQTVLVQIFPVVRDLYLALREDERQRFDREFTTLFFMHAATQPVINAEKLLALMEAGVVEVIRMGRDYRFSHNESERHFEFHFSEDDGRTRSASFSYCIDARGQARSIESDCSALTRNLLARGLIQIHPKKSSDGSGVISSGWGSVLIDPDTHQVIPARSRHGGKSNFHLFAVGAMTRGQIIDASMAYGLARSTETVAQQLIGKLSGLHEKR
ncbi:MAG: FAD/NAD(P)-binding protein [Desulfofustis sp.]|nr:FAD/NAD(P)-binding protein [Desulfofustis sp.]